MNLKELEAGILDMAGCMYAEINEDTGVFWVSTNSNKVTLSIGKDSEEQVAIKDIVGDYTGKYTVGYGHKNNTLVVRRETAGKWTKTEECGYEKLE